MKKKLLKTFLLAVGLLVGGSAWADDEVVTLNCTNSITIVGTSEYGTDGSTYSSTIYLNSYAKQGGAGAFSFTLDANWDPSKVKSAILKFYPISKCNNSGRSGDIYIKALASYPASISEISTSYSDGKHIVYSHGGDKTKRYNFADAATATIIANGANTAVPAKDAYYDVDLTTYIKGLSTKSAGDAIFFGIDISDWAAGIKIGAYGSEFAPKLVVTYTDEVMYTATFTANSGTITPTVTIYSDEGRTSTVTNGTLTDGTTYYYRAVLEGYADYEGSFTVSGAAPSVSFNMTAKTPVTSIKVKYTYGGSVIDTDNQDVTYKYVGEAYTAPFRMYILKDGVLYQTTKNNTDPNYGEAVTLTAETVVEKALSLIDLKGGKVVLFEDLDYTDGQNAGIRASYCSAYDNRAYTSAEDLPAGTYTFYLFAQNKGRGSCIKVGDTQIVAASDIGGSGSWNAKTLTDVSIPTAGKLTIAAGGSNTRDDYDIIIAVLNKVSVTVTDAGYATYVPSYDLNFTSTGIKAYKVKVTEKGKATMNQVNYVPAGAPVLLYKEGGATEDIPVMTGAAAFGDGTNDLVAGTGAAVATDGGTEDEVAYTNMILNNGTYGIGFYFANNKLVAANRAYLHIASSLAPGEAGSRMTMVFGDEATGISTVNGEGLTWFDELSTKYKGYYNLNGQKVMQPTKGLYIKDGKKVLVK